MIKSNVLETKTNTMMDAHFKRGSSKFKLKFALKTLLDERLEISN